MRAGHHRQTCPRTWSHSRHAPAQTPAIVKTKQQTSTGLRVSDFFWEIGEWGSREGFWEKMHMLVIPLYTQIESGVSLCLEEEV